MAWEPRGNLRGPQGPKGDPGSGGVPSTLTLTAGNGLTGGGDLSQNRAFQLGVPGTITGSTANAVQATSHTHALSPNLKTWDGVTPSSKLDTDYPAPTNRLTLTASHLSNRGMTLRDTSGSLQGGIDLQTSTIVWNASAGGRVFLRANGVSNPNGEFSVGTDRAIITGSMWDALNINSSYSTGDGAAAIKFENGGNVRYFGMGNKGDLRTSADNVFSNGAKVLTSEDFDPTATMALSADGTAILRNSNWDGITKTGLYYNSSSVAEGPTNVSAISLLHIEQGGSNASQIAWRTGSNQMWSRRRQAGSWLPWVEYWHSENLNPSDYVPTSRSINAGNGLAGGGNFTANRTISLGTPGTLSGSTTNSVTTSSHTHALSANLSAWDGVTVASKADASDFTYVGNKSGGSYDSHVGSGNNFAYLWHSAGGQPSDAPFSPARQAAVLSMGNSWGRVQLAVSNEATPQVFVRGGTENTWTSVWTSGNFTPGDYTPTTRAITAGNGLSGGGSLAANRTISLGTPGTITGTSTNSVSSTSHTHALNTDGNFTWNGNHTFIGDIIGRSGSASNQLEVERTGNSINAGIQYRTTAGTIYAGQGDSGHFAWGTGTDLRYSASATWGRISANGLEIKSSISAADVSTTGDMNASGNVYARGNLFRRRADNSAWEAQPRFFIQSGNPGARASDGDLWGW